MTRYNRLLPRSTSANISARLQSPRNILNSHRHASPEQQSAIDAIGIELEAAGRQMDETQDLESDNYLRDMSNERLVIKQMQAMQQNEELQDEMQWRQVLEDQVRGQDPQGQPQLQRATTPQVQSLYLQYYKNMMLAEAPKYGGNVQLIPPTVKQQLQSNAQKQAIMMMQQREKARQNHVQARQTQQM